MYTRFVKRSCSTTNIVPCGFCKHYSPKTQACNKFFEFDKFSGEKTYYYAKFVRSDDSKCGLENPKLYESALKDLRYQHTEQSHDLALHLAMLGVTGVSFGMSTVAMIFVNCNWVFLAMPTSLSFILAIDRFKNLRYENDKIVDRIRTIENHPNYESLAKKYNNDSFW